MNDTIIDTIHVRKCEENLKLVQDDAVLGILFGMPGTGKTYTVTELAKQYDWIMITAFPAITIKSICVSLCEAMGMDVKGTSVKLTQEIIEELRNRETLIIVDEADQLNRKNTTNVIEHLRIVADLSNTGLVFVGTITFEKEVDRGYKKILLEQFNSRIGMKMQMENLRFLDMQSIWEKAYTKEVIKEIYKYTKGNMRRIQRLLSRAEVMRKINSFDKITREIIIAAAEVVGVDGRI